MTDEEELENPMDLMESGKKLEQALASAVDDSLKKGKTVAGAGVVTNAKSKPNQPAAARSKKTGKPGKNSKKKGPGNNQGGGHDALGARMGGKITGDVISEEMDDEGQENAALPSAMDVIDPDSKTLEDFYRKCEDDDPKWNSILDVQDIILRRDTRNSYVMSCKVLGIIPASTVISNLESTDIQLAHRGIGPKGAEALAEALERNTTVVHVDLSNNFIAEGGESVGRYLATNHTITYLNLSNNRLGRQSANSIAEMIAENGVIQSLLLSGNDFSDKEVEMIAGGLRQNLGMKELDLSHNDIGDIGCLALGSALVSHGNLTTLNLGISIDFNHSKAWNKIRSKGFTGFLNTIKDSSSLSSLNLQRNGIGETATTMGTFLSRSNSLSILNLSSNRIGDNMIQIIAKCLESSSNLTELDVSHNLFTEKGTPAFLKAILNNNNLVKLNVKGIRFTLESIAKLQELRSEKGIEIID